MKNHPGTASRFYMPNSKIGNEIIISLRSLKYMVHHQKTINIEDLYLDTFDFRLFRKNFSLRLRKTDKKCWYILQPLGKTGENPVHIGAIEGETTGKPWNITSKEINSEISEIIFPRRLVTQITARIRRSVSVILCPDKTEVSMAFDMITLHSQTAAGKRTARLYATSLELKTGSEETFHALVRAISALFSLSSSSSSLLQEAVESLMIRFPLKNPPPEMTVQADDRLDTAVNKILLFQFQRLNENIPGAIEDIDTEFVHQARVSTRKMRSLLRLLGDAVPQRTREYFSGELYWLGSLFGAVRDMDVFLLNMDKTRNEILHAPEHAMGILLRQIHQERSEKLAVLKEGLTSARWRIFSLRLSSFIKRKETLHPQSPLALTTVRQGVSTIIVELYNGLITRGNRILLKPKLKNFHKLRIQFKKIRYASEFFNPAFNNSLSSFIAEVTKIQDCLGELQDTVFTRKLIKGFMKKWRGNVIDPRIIFILGEIYQLQDGIARARQDEFYKIWERFAHQDTVLKLNGTLGNEKNVPIQTPDP